MTIHHDKFAYGKLKSCDEQLSQDALSKIIRQMNASEDDVATEAYPEPADANMTSALTKEPDPEESADK
ncbi:MAG: hypothetical protein LUD51_03035 [Clostridia bacterium]|nr:hypothetical protein [Clostridia bacterium]